MLTIDMGNYLEKEYTVGRRESNDIVLWEISVSRLHCRILISNGKVFVRNNKSKFGTLIEAGKKISLDELKTSDVVVGNLRLTFHIFRSKFCCGKLAEKSSIVNPLRNNPLYLKKN